jgi:hypothetical protein
MEQAIIKKSTNKIIPHPTPVQEQPRLKPNRFCNHSKSQSNNKNFNKPEKQPGRDSIAFSL